MTMGLLQNLNTEVAMSNGRVLWICIGGVVAKQQNKATEFWAETINHIDSLWHRKKGRKYPFTGQDMKLIKQLRGWLTAPEVMAMFTVYCSSSPFWGTKSGYLISGMWQERSILLDDSNFKKLVAKYELELGLKDAKEVG